MDNKNKKDEQPCTIAGVSCCGFSVGETVNTPYGKGEVWKVTETSVHVKHESPYPDSEWLFSKYLTEPWHHSQNSVESLSHCN